MWTSYLVIFLVNFSNIYGRDLMENNVRRRRDVYDAQGSSSMQNYDNYGTRSTESSYKPTNYFIPNTSKYNTVRYDTNNYNSNNGMNRYNDTGFIGYHYNNTSSINTNKNKFSDYSGNYNYESAPTNYNHFVSSTSDYNNVRYNYSDTMHNNNYQNNDLYNRFNGAETNTYRNDNAVTYPSHNLFPDYNGNYNYENNVMYNPFNGTGYNIYRYFNITPSTNNLFPGYKVNGSAVYEPTHTTIPKQDTTGFRFDNFYPISKYNVSAFNSQTPKYSNTNTPDMYNYQDPNQNNFSGYVQEQTMDKNTSMPPVQESSTRANDDKPKIVDACVLCNIGCPANHSRKGLYCVPDNFDYQ